MSSSPIAEYQIVIRQDCADIHLYSSNNTLVGSVYFKADGTPLLPASQDTSGRIVLQYPLSQLASVVDVLRNESPLYIFYASPSVAYIATCQEAVGDGEG